MKNADCAAFLHWALPQLGLHCPGFRNVRGQVCKRLRRRMHELHLADFAAYQARLVADPAEWRVVDACCHITISRFFRDRIVFETLRRRVLPDVASRAGREQRPVRVWSAGCASGEEPYSVKILWDLDIAEAFPAVPLIIVATDIDAGMVARARAGCFKPASLRDVPIAVAEQAFERRGPLFCVKAAHREGIAFVTQDLRSEMPQGLFDLILCRYVAFTYFTAALQQMVLARLIERLQPKGYLVIGRREVLPGGTGVLKPLEEAPEFFRLSS